MRWSTLQHVSQVSPSPNKAIIPSRGRSASTNQSPASTSNERKEEFSVKGTLEIQKKYTKKGIISKEKEQA